MIIEGIVELFSQHCIPTHYQSSTGWLFQNTNPGASTNCVVAGKGAHNQLYRQAPKLLHDTKKGSFISHKLKELSITPKVL